MLFRSYQGNHSAATANYAAGTDFSQDGTYEEWGVKATNPAISITKSAAITPIDIGGDGKIGNVNEDITYTVAVSNIGNVALTGVSVTDQIENYGTQSLGVPGAPATGVTIVESGSGTHGNATLDIGETWTYTFTHDVTATDISNELPGGGGDGDHNIHNAATVVTAQTAPISATADVPVVAQPLPNISIDKVTVDGSLSGDGLIVVAGEPISWLYKVTNTGNVVLSNVTVTDDQGVTPVYQSGDSNSDGKLDTTETWIYKASGTAHEGDYTNVGTVSGSYLDYTNHISSVTASDSSSYYGEESITLDKVTVYGSVSEIGRAHV